MIAQRYEKEFVPRSGIKEYRSLTQVLKKESARVNGIIQQFLRFARPPKLKLANVALKQFTEHISTLFSGQAMARKIEFLAVCKEDLHTHMDYDQMTQAVLNLLQNALDATATGGSISMNIFQREHHIIIEIADNGSGISASNLTKIFNLYFSTKDDGSGMGLAITQQIVSQHQGSIHVQSEPLKGSTFSILLPNN